MRRALQAATGPLSILESAIKPPVSSLALTGAIFSINIALARRASSNSSARLSGMPAEILAQSRVRP